MDFLDSVQFTNDTESSLEKYSHEQEITEINNWLINFLDDESDCEVVDTWLDGEDDDFIITVDGDYNRLLSSLKNKFNNYNIFTENDEDYVHIVIKFDNVTEEQAAHTDGYKIIEPRIGSSNTIVFDYFIVNGDSKVKVRKSDYYNKFSDYIDMTQVEVLKDKNNVVFLTNGDEIFYDDAFKKCWYVIINSSGYAKPIIGATDKESAVKIHISNSL